MHQGQHWQQIQHFLFVAQEHFLQMRIGNIKRFDIFVGVRLTGERGFNISIFGGAHGHRLRCFGEGRKLASNCNPRRVAMDIASYDYSSVKGIF